MRAERLGAVCASRRGLRGVRGLACKGAAQHGGHPPGHCLTFWPIHLVHANCRRSRVSCAVVAHSRISLELSAGTCLPRRWPRPHVACATVSSSCSCRRCARRSTHSSTAGQCFQQTHRTQDMGATRKYFCEGRVHRSIVYLASELDLLVLVCVGEEIALHHRQLHRRLRHVLPHRAEVVLRTVALRRGHLIRA